MDLTDRDTIQSILDDLSSAYQKFARDPEPGECVLPPGIITPSMVAAHVQRSLKAQWPDTADLVVAKCGWNDAEPRLAVVEFYRADTGAPIRAASDLMSILSPMRSQFEITQVMIDGYVVDVRDVSIEYER